MQKTAQEIHLSDDRRVGCTSLFHLPTDDEPLHRDVVVTWEINFFRRKAVLFRIFAQPSKRDSPPAKDTALVRQHHRVSSCKSSGTLSPSDKSFHFHMRELNRRSIFLPFPHKKEFFLGAPFLVSFVSR